MTEKRWRTAAVTFLLGAIVGTAPAVARVIADYAKDSGRVDGFSATSADKDAGRRAGKLVATDRRGRLPNDIIERAPDSRRLRDEPPGHYEDTRCELGLAADAFVPGDVAADPTVVGDAYKYSGRGHNGDPLLYDCVRRNVFARRVAPGIYRLNFGHAASCPIQQGQLSTLVTVNGEAGLVATAETVCEGDEAEEEVRITSGSGTPVDASFTVLLLTPLPQPQFG